MSILDQIVAHKYQEVEERKSLHPFSVLEKSVHFQRTPVSLKNSIIRHGSFGIIAEFKRKSPSKGVINESALPEKVCSGYLQAGCSAVSVLTDSKYFGGSSDDLKKVRANVGCPVLRKEFIIDEYQIVEAKALGADAVLLIAELHDTDKLEQLYRFARSLELEVLVEVHDFKNISRIPCDTQIAGINSRNLSSFKVDFTHLSKMINLLPRNVIKIAESGIKSASDYMTLKETGFNGFLIGELFMNTPDPGASCKKFINEIKLLDDIKTGMV